MPVLAEARGCCNDTFLLKLMLLPVDGEIGYLRYVLAAFEHPRLHWSQIIRVNPVASVAEASNCLGFVQTHVMLLRSRRRLEDFGKP